MSALVANIYIASTPGIRTLQVLDTYLISSGRETLQVHGANLTSTKPSRTDKDYKTNEETMKVKIMVNNNDESMSSLN